MKTSILTAAVLFLFFCAISPSINAQGMFYMEETKDGRIYVFNNMKAYDEWKKGGEMGKSLTRIGAGPNGETVVFDSEEAIHLYNFKHNLPDEVILKTETPAPAVQEKLPYKFSGYMFGDYFYNVQRDANIANIANITQPGAEDLNGFIFRRIYLTFDDDISPDFQARFRLEASASDVLPNGKISVFVKDAYLRWKNAVGSSDFYFGIQPTPAYEISEAAWRYRSLEKTIMDLRGIVPSRDIAASLRGKLDSAAKYNYWVEFGNGSGNVPETDKFKRLYLHFQWKPSEKFQATLYQDFRFLPDIPDPNSTTATLDNDSYTTAWFVNYGSKDKYGLGYEGFITNQENGVKLGSAAPFGIDDKGTSGHSVWGWYDFNSVVGVVGRYDYFEPNDNSIIEGDKRDLIIASLVLRPHKNVWIMPNVIWEGIQDGPGGVKFDSAITARITFYYIFL